VAPCPLKPMLVGYDVCGLRLVSAINVGLGTLALIVVKCFCLLCFAGCTFGCICRLFVGRKFSRLVTCGNKPKSSFSAAHASYLKEALARFGLSFSDHNNDEIAACRKLRKFINPVNVKSKRKNVLNDSCSTSSYRAGKFARMGCLLSKISDKSKTLPSYSGIVKRSDSTKSSAARRPPPHSDVLTDAGTSLTSENANEVVDVF
jgi:hypothetical protein